MAKKKIVITAYGGYMDAEQQAEFIEKILVQIRKDYDLDETDEVPFDIVVEQKLN